MKPNNPNESELNKSNDPNKSDELSEIFLIRGSDFIK